MALCFVSRQILNLENEADLRIDHGNYSNRSPHNIGEYPGRSCSPILLVYVYLILLGPTHASALTIPRVAPEAGDGRCALCIPVLEVAGHGALEDVSHICNRSSEKGELPIYRWTSCSGRTSGTLLYPSWNCSPCYRVSPHVMKRELLDKTYNKTETILDVASTTAGNGVRGKAAKVHVSRKGGGKGLLGSGIGNGGGKGLLGGGMGNAQESQSGKKG